MFFEPVKRDIQKYDVVLIDEIQDYLQEWLDILSNYFMHKETEWVVFGDEKQDIYQRKLVIRNIPGSWNKSLQRSFRLSSRIYLIALEFQKKFFIKKYNLDFDDETLKNLRSVPQLLEFDYTKRIIEYYYFKTFSVIELFEAIYNVLQKNEIHSSDAGVICSKVEILRGLDFLIRTKKNEKTATTFESQEEFDKIKREETNNLINNGIPESEVKFHTNRAMHERLEGLRKSQKNHFWMKTGTVKLSTVHSFKGWEIDTLFLFIENEENNNEFTNAELIYTGLTRAKRNLVIFNLGNIKYHDFFQLEITMNN